MDDSTHCFMEICMTFKNVRCAHKYSDYLNFNVGDELDIGLAYHRLYTACGAGYMKELDGNKIELRIIGWLQKSNLDVDDVKMILGHFLHLGSIKPELLEITFNNIPDQKRVLVTWKSKEEDSFRTASVPEAFYDGIHYALLECEAGDLDKDKQLLDRALRSFSPFVTVRHWYLPSKKELPYV